MLVLKNYDNLFSFREFFKIKNVIKKYIYLGINIINSN